MNIMILQRRFLILVIIIVLLLIPLIAMKFTEEVQWNSADFLIAGTLLFILGWTLEWTWRKVSSKRAKSMMILGSILLFIFIWIELAVGVFGTPLAGK